MAANEEVHENMLADTEKSPTLWARDFSFPAALGTAERASPSFAITLPYLSRSLQRRRSGGIEPDPCLPQEIVQLLSTLKL
jgi:hypothetical protein